MGGGDINKSGDSREPGLRNIENIMNRPNVRLISAAFRCAYIQGPFIKILKWKPHGIAAPAP